MFYFQQAALGQGRKINLLERRGENTQDGLKTNSHFLSNQKWNKKQILGEETPFESCGALVLYEVTSG